MNAKKVKKQKANMSLRVDCKSAWQSIIVSFEIAASALRLPRNDIMRILIVLFFLAVSRSVYADSARALVEQGNSLYSQGNFNKAIEKYDAALIDEPQVLEPKFNKANSYYMLEDFSNAIDLFRQVASESKDMKLVAKAKYNLGNCFFQQGMKQKDSDLQKSVDDLQNSIANWRQTLEIEPDNQNAAKNIEVARIIIKDIIDQINKQKQEQEKQAQQQQQMQEKLKELAEKQKSLSGQSQQTQEQLDKQQIDQQKASDDYQKQSQEQSQLQNETEQAKQELEQQDPNNPMSQQMQEAAKELEQAEQNQKKAQQQLENSDGKGAKESQDKAAEHIEKALEKLSQGDNQQQSDNSQQQPQQQQGEQEQNQEQDQSEQNQNQQEQDQVAPNATAQEILDKEQKDKEQRQMLQRPANQKVEKDW